MLKKLFAIYALGFWLILFGISAVTWNGIGIGFSGLFIAYIIRYMWEEFQTWKSSR